MQALLCRRHGPASSLELAEVESPEPAPDEILVAVRAVGINFPDTLIIEDKYQIKPTLPFAPGGECSGVVTAVGANVRGFAVGAPVIALPGYGCLAEQIACAATRVIPVPPGVDFAIASAFLMTYATSYHALVDRAGLAAGETLVVLGASGGVGLAAVEIGKQLGARVIAAASTPAKLAVCRDHGADEVIDYATEDLKGAIKRLTDGRGADVIYDPVGGPCTEAALRSCAWRGRLLVVGFAHGDIPRLPANLALLKGCAVVGVFWGDYVRREPARFATDLQTLFAWLGEGRLRPHIAATYPLARGGEAIAALAERRVSGKVVVTMPAYEA